MPNPMLLMAGVSAGGGILSANAQKKAAAKASDAQVEGTRLSIEEQRRQFDVMQQLAKPYVEAGGEGMSAYKNLLGMNGNAAQQSAIGGIQNSAEFGSMVQNGEDAITANASATGGLRGGNTQSALAQFRPQILSQLINKQLGNLQGLTTMGQNSAMGVGSAAMNMGNNISQSYGDAAAARAGNYMAAGQANANMIGGLTGGIGNILGGIQPPAGATTFGKWGF